MLLNDKLINWLILNHSDRVSNVSRQTSIRGTVTRSFAICADLWFWADLYFCAELWFLHVSRTGVCSKPLHESIVLYSFDQHHKWIGQGPCDAQIFHLRIFVTLCRFFIAKCADLWHGPICDYRCTYLCYLLKMYVSCRKCRKAAIHGRRSKPNHQRFATVNSYLIQNLAYHT